jgi:hypothetical protein
VNRTDTQVWALFQPLWDDQPKEDNFFERRPVLAHYTSTSSLEKIVASNEIWFSNPLFMNDVEEVLFGIDEGTRAFLGHSGISEAFGPNHQKFGDALLQEHRRFIEAHAFDTYILCLSEHDHTRDDGLLSMWRGYGDAGRGVAIVINPLALPNTPTVSPLVVAKVYYGTRSERADWFLTTASRFAKIVVENKLTDEGSIPLAAMALFSRLRLFSLYTKHDGFSEEREWRIAYLPERDTMGLFKGRLGYFNGPRGVEPKLKFAVETIPEVSDVPFSMETLVSAIILGPSAASDLTLNSVRRMLEALGRPELGKRLAASRIPFRPL